MRGSAASAIPAWLRDYPGAVLHLAPDGTVVDSNARLEDELGRALVEVPLARVLDPSSAHKLERLLAEPAERRDPPRVELTLLARDGLETRVFSALWELRPGAPRLWLVEHPRDAGVERLHDELNEVNTELVNTQRELSKRGAHLANALRELKLRLAENEELSRALQEQYEEMEVQNEELRVLTEELNASQDQLLGTNEELELRTRALEDALASRGRFFASLSHELRTPINAVMGYNDLLAAGVYGPLSAAQAQAVDRAQRAARHLRELIDDVLDIAKIESGKLTLALEEVDLAMLSRELFVTVQPLAGASGCELSLRAAPGLEPLVTDPRRVRQVLLNLLSNAIKYGAGRPVELLCAPLDGGGALVEVRDHGEGLDEASLRLIFDEFEQLGRGEPGGTGLGLPIARRLAQRLGGSLDAISTPGQGSVFRLTLPGPAPPA